MVHLLDLDNDIFTLLFTLLNMPALCALASSSREGFQLVAPALVRTIKLSRGPQQVLACCEFTLKHHLSSHIISFTLFESATYSQPPKDYLKGYRRDLDVDESALFARTLAKVLEGAVNLTHLAFDKCTDLMIRAEQQIADIICHNPPLSLELSHTDTFSFQMFSSISGLVNLKLVDVYPPKYDEDAEQALGTILVNSIHTLETLSLGHAFPANLRSEYSEYSSSLSWERVHYLSMNGVPLFPEQLACSFPNLRSIEITPSYPMPYTLDKQIDCPSHTLWPVLQSFSGPKELALNLSQYHTLRRLSFSKTGPDSIYTKASSLHQLSDTVRNSDLRSLTLTLKIQMPAMSLSTLGTSNDLTEPSSNSSQPLLDLLFSTLAQWACRLTYLSLDCVCLDHVGRETLPGLEYLKKNASILTSLSSLKYFELGVTSLGRAWLVPQVEFFKEPEELVHAWVDSVPSLQYLELTVFRQRYEHSWWRIECKGSQRRTFRRVSKEEGLSAKNWFDMEEWR